MRIAILIPFLMVLVANSSIASIQNDYALLSNRRISLENQDKDYVARRQKLDNASTGITKRWARCAGGCWAIIWSPFEARLDEARKALEKKRNEIYQLKLSIMKAGVIAEKSRHSIELKYADSKGIKYEEEFREYMNELEHSYLIPFEEQYLYALDQYLTAVEVWQESANEAIRACNNKDIRAIILEMALKNLEKVFTLLSTIGKLL